MKKPASLFVVPAALLLSLAISVNALAVDSTLLYYKSHDSKLKYDLTITSKSRPEAVFELGPLEETEDFLTLSQRVVSELNETRSTGGRVRHWFNPEKSINILLGGQRSTPITWLTKQEVHFELLGEKQ